MSTKRRRITLQPLTTATTATTATTITTANAVPVDEAPVKRTKLSTQKTQKCTTSSSDDSDSLCTLVEMGQKVGHINYLIGLQALLHSVPESSATVKPLTVHSRLMNCFNYVDKVLQNRTALMFRSLTPMQKVGYYMINNNKSLSRYFRWSLKTPLHQWTGIRCCPTHSVVRELDLSRQLNRPELVHTLDTLRLHKDFVHLDLSHNQDLFLSFSRKRHQLIDKLATLLDLHKNLQYLNLEMNRITCIYLSVWAKVDFPRQTSLSNKSLRFTCVTHLYMSGNYLDKGSMRRALGTLGFFKRFFPKLEHVDLSECCITTFDVEAYLPPSIKSVVLRNNYLRQKDFKVQQPTLLEYLDISGNGLLQEDQMHLLRAKQIRATKSAYNGYSVIPYSFHCKELILVPDYNFPTIGPLKRIPLPFPNRTKLYDVWKFTYCFLPHYVLSRVTCSDIFERLRKAGLPRSELDTMVHMRKKLGFFAQSTWGNIFSFMNGNCIKVVHVL